MTDPGIGNRCATVTIRLRNERDHKRHPDEPWTLKTPPGKSEYTADRDPDADPPALVVTVGTIQLRYHLRAIDDLAAMLAAEGEHNARNNRMRVR